ncbi:MAG: holo-ACP synthase [Tissierellaceae bacterium]|nr:holo-ACP synthase [Tissierellaceae bacterium]
MITTGVDIVQISRIEKLMNNKRDLFFNRIFTEKEINHIIKKGSNPKTVAGIYAAKEAISKSLGTGIGQVGWKDMEVIHDDKGKPHVNPSSKITPILETLDINRFDLSISHDGDYAIAFVVGYYQP